MYLFCLCHICYAQNHIAVFPKTLPLIHNVLVMTSCRLRRTAIIDTRMNVTHKCETPYGRAKTRRGLGMWGGSGKEMTARETRDKTAV